MLDLLQLPKHAAVMLSGSALSSLIRPLVPAVHIPLSQQHQPLKEQEPVDP